VLVAVRGQHERRRSRRARRAVRRHQPVRHADVHGSRVSV